MLNHITLMGRMTRNPETRYTPAEYPGNLLFSRRRVRLSAGRGGEADGFY